MAGKFELYKSTEQYRFRLKAGNGEPILSSEGYTSKSGAEDGIQSVKTNSQNAASYERNETGSGQHFVLKAGNNELIGRSETYSSSAALEKGIESVMLTAPDAPIVDLT